MTKYAKLSTVGSELEAIEQIIKTLPTKNSR
jgi:hypothetical protein